MAKKKRSKQRAEFRKNSQGRVRKSDFTREFKGGNEDDLAEWLGVRWLELDRWILDNKTPGV